MKRFPRYCGELTIGIPSFGTYFKEMGLYYENYTWQFRQD